MVISEKLRTIVMPSVPSNGRFVPSFSEMNHTPESIDKIKKALTNQPKSREHVRNMSTVWEAVRPLFLRGALPVEIAMLTGFSHKQVRNALYRRRPDYNSVPSILFSKQLETERRRKAAAPGKPKKISERVQTIDEKNSYRFAKELLRRGIMPSDLSFFDILLNFYKAKGRQMPESFFDRLRLEVFLAAIKKVQIGDMHILDIYNDIGRRIDSDWFNLSLILEQELVAKTSGNGLIFEEDGKGLYRMDEGRRKWRRLEVNVEGETIFDNLELVKLRRQRRGNIR